MIVFEGLLRLVDILHVFDGILTLDHVRWLHSRSWSAVDQTLGRQLSLFYLFEVLFLFLVCFLCLFNFSLRFDDLALSLELLGQLLIHFAFNLSKPLLGFSSEVLHLLFADGALLCL